MVCIPSVADEADGSGSLDLFAVDVEICRPVPTRGDNELSTLEKNRSGIIFGLRGKIPLTLNSELPFDRDADFPQIFPVSCSTLYRVMFLSLWFLNQTVAS
jgi:hypothetical protein